MKTLAVVLAALLLSILPARAIDLSGIEAATMILYANGQEVCSSQVVHSADGDTILLTANHCVDGPKDTEFSIRIITKNDEREVVSYTIYTAKVFKRDAKTDLAVLRLMDDKIVLAATELATAEEADTALFKGASVLAAGYPGTFSSGMEDLVFSDGLFTGVRDSFEPSVKVGVYRSTAPVWYGKSGGGLYTKIGDTWKLVGVATQLDPETPWDTSLWIPVEHVQSILKGAWSDGKPVDLSDPGYFEK